MAGKNETVNEFEGSGAVPTDARSEASVGRRSEQAIAAAHQRPAGPRVTSTAERQSRLKRPRVVVG
jgi:hypothetical protein